MYYKVARLDGFDFHTGNTINYRENVGKIVKNPKTSTELRLCSDSVLHASEDFFDALGYAELPCSIYVVGGTPVVTQSDKVGFTQLRVIEEISTKHWREAYQDWVIWLLQDVQQYVGRDQDQVITAINGVINLFQQAKTRNVKKSEYEAAARAAAWAATGATVWATEAAAWATEAARAAAWVAAGSINRDAAWAAWAAWDATRAIAWAAVRAATGSINRDAAWAAAKKKYSEKFLEILKGYN